MLTACAPRRPKSHAVSLVGYNAPHSGHRDFVLVGDAFESFAPLARHVDFKVALLISPNHR
jgi:hypothetical protein